jgi:malonate decarboxylase gamma subunit
MTINVLRSVSAASARILVALPGPRPEVVDLPSMAHVTKLPIEVLTEKATSTPVLTPGLENLSQTGTIFATWDETRSLARQLRVQLHERRVDRDQRDALGKERSGRLRAADILGRVRELALQEAR